MGLSDAPAPRPPRRGATPRASRVTQGLIWIALCAALIFPAGAAASQIYVTSRSDGSVSAFSIGAAGSLSPITCTTGCKTESPLSDPNGIAASPNGRFIFVADSNGNGNGKAAGGTVQSFEIEPGGELSPIACPSDCKAGGEPWGVAVAPNGQTLYTVNAESDSVSAFSIAADGSLTPIECTTGCALAAGSDPEDIAVSPGGTFLYVAERETRQIAAFSIAADGSLSKVGCTTGCTTETDPFGLAITPSGHFLYTAVAQKIEAFEVAADGTLKQIHCTQCSTAAYPRALAISPNGRYLYTTNNNTPESSVPAFEIQRDGTLTPIAGCGGPYCHTANAEAPEGLAVSPSGRFVYASDTDDKLLTKSFEEGIVSAFGIGAGGELSQIECPKEACAIGENTGFFGLTITPDEGPTAAFSATTAPAGSASEFDGSASTASSPDVTVAGYEWNFGDGSSAQSSGPTPTHIYSAPGTYTVTLTVTDSGGCSTHEIYTGQSASCTGSSAATATQTVTVPAAGAGQSGTSAPSQSAATAPSLTGLSESRRIWREGRAPARISSHATSSLAPLGTTFSLVLNEAASVTLQFTKSAAGRSSNGKCVAQTPRNRHRRACTRTISAGTITLPGRAGANKVAFDGVLSGHAKLAPAAYVLHASASASGKSSAPGILRFTMTAG